MKFTAHEQKVITEIRRRIRVFNKDMVMVYLGYPSEVKSLIQKGILTPYSSQTPRVLNWYNLTELGKNTI
jgi:hypothetical protein